jgi:ATP-dependent Clp protease ATP-binding subunit ClpB
MALKHTPIDSEALLTYLRSQVKGQDPILKDLAISLQALESAQRPGRPMASFLFVGQHAVGKSELAKAIADFLFEGRWSRFHGAELDGPESEGWLIGVPVGYIGSEKGGALTRPVLENPRRLFCIEEFQRVYPLTRDLFGRLLAEGQLKEWGSDKIADFSQSILIFSSGSIAVEIGRIQQEMTDYDQIVRAVEKQSAESEFFRPLFEGGIDRVFPFRELDSRAFAEIGLVRFQKLANELGLSVEFIEYESLIDQLARKYQAQTKKGIYAWKGEIVDRFWADLDAAKKNGARGVKLRVGTDGELTVSG